MDNPLKRTPPPTPSETRPMCGCGLSRTFPFCDGTQMISKSHLEGRLVSCGAAEQTDRAIAKARVP